MAEGKVIELTKSQTTFFEADKGIDNDIKAIAIVTGFGGGKTFILSLKLIELALKYPNCDILYLMPVFSMFRDVLLPSLHEILDDTNIQFKVNKTTGELLIGDGIGRVILKSMDSPEAIVGINAVACILDEIDTLILTKAEAVWQKAIARARKAVNVTNEDGEIVYNEDGKARLIVNRMYIGTTPEGMKFMHKMFVKNKPDNYLLIQASGRENIYLPKDYYDNLALIYPENLIEAYIDGKFVNMSTGSVYKDYDREKCDTKEEYRTGEPIFVSMDFNVMNCNSVIYVKRSSLRDTNNAQEGYMYNDKPTLHAIGHLHSVLDTPATIEALKALYGNSVVNCFPDSSGKNASTRGFTTSDVSLLKQAGFIVRYPKKNPNIMDRVLAVNSALKTGLVKVNQDKTPKLVEALEEQAFSEGTGLPEKFPGASIDDITDAFGYMIHFLYPVKRKSMRAVAYEGT